jgi:hypothetical protein
MTDDRSLERAARWWLEAGPTQAPDRAVEAALLRIETTTQERDLRVPWRLPRMSTPARAATTAVIGVLAIGALFMLGRSGQPGVGGPNPTPTPATSPTPSPTLSKAAAPSPAASPSTSKALTGFPEGPLRAGTYVLAPFTAAGEGMCHVPPQPGCTETTADDAIHFTMTVPEGWHALGPWVFVDGNEAPGGAGFAFARGAWLLSDPCQSRLPRIPVGPTVADFVDAVATHPILDTTTPVDVTLAGYSGKYFDLQVPADISTGAQYRPECPSYRPWEPGIYANGPSQRWHLWVIDVDGVRVVVQSMDYPGTSAAHRAELQSIVDSIKIDF